MQLNTSGVMNFKYISCTALMQKYRSINMQMVANVLYFVVDCICRSPRSEVLTAGRSSGIKIWSKFDELYLWTLNVRLT